MLSSSGDLISCWAMKKELAGHCAYIIQYRLGAVGTLNRHIITGKRRIMRGSSGLLPGRVGWPEGPGTR